MARPTLTKAHRGLLGLVAAGAFIISGIGFAGSYNAVRELAQEKGFGAFSYAFPIGVDAGIVVLLALDLVLTWLRIPFPMLRQTAWVLTVATIAFNAAASWGDPLGMGMHAVIPVLFVVVVEASRHAVGRIAAITADRHMESVRVMRWILSPVPTFRLWRRMKLWELRSYDEVIRLEQNRLVYRAQLRFRYGRGWRRSAPIQALLPLKLAKFGVPLDPALLDRLDDQAREREASEVPAGQEPQALPGQEGRAAALAPAAAGSSAQAGPPQQLTHPQQLPQQAPQAQQPQPATAQAAQAAQVAQAEAAAPAPLPAEVAAPMLAKLAAVRLRAAQEPEEAADVVPQPHREELNVWTERPVRTTGHPTDAAPGGRVPGQASPWFKPPRPVAEEPADSVAAAAPVAAPVPVPTAGPAPTASGSRTQAQHPAGPQQSEQPVEPQPGPARQPAQQQAQPVGAEQPVPAEEPAPADLPESHQAPSRLDPDLAYEALVTYMDNHNHQPDPQRLADWLTREYGVTGKGLDGSVHPKEVAELYPELRDRYEAAGRD
ncbi:hypothetical protein GCM10018790_71770 [Kitasatospora xanthocidica]|uniref:DUF2637 domain-containing protein n=1 Tax=Kitasatospora xanthocidica TaxID=83382 RepID=UPI0019B3F2DA|nr:DUF2637 domain-containing protein [Kitasatospora xanthocidica]GHF83813.1 hypothetical protein GCM10018790_71770 [Kitasatospora xanthocidica]